LLKCSEFDYFPLHTMLCCISIATVVTETRHTVTVYVHCISCLEFRKVIFFYKTGGLLNQQCYKFDKATYILKYLHQRLPFCEEKSVPCKRRKEQVTILACCNNSGNHKLKRAFIEKCKETYGYKYSYKNISGLI